MTTNAYQRARQRRRVAARHRVVARGQGISRWTLAARYGWVCGICGQHIMCDGRDLTIDHIVPLSRGGTHTWDNVQPAHQRCNVAKGAR